ncbi:hypothetical protein CVT26_007648 [Gymnopilus dilepis]|uniref:F-box domain-containing protein n=1 Tax=Gymnopilus dilepis TaxID=231916 RepID=A0A409WTF0_9AGAR|nr:hypothetical protein CVT26_007648 [Gymnopilus dilepis]
MDELSSDRETVIEPPDSFDLSEEDLCIAQLDRHIQTFRVLRAKICSSRNRRLPINSLPTEIMSEVFLLAQTATEKEKGPCQPTVFPLVLGSVCRKWRHIAWSLSELWGEFHCRISMARCELQASLLQEWLERSQQRPLSICISIMDEEEWTGPDVSTAILDAIIPYSERWVHLGLILPEAWYRQLRQVRGKVPNLLYLCIRSPTCKSPLSSFRTFAHETSIRKLFASNFRLSNLHLPWNLLDTVVLEGLTTNEAIDVIRRCQNATFCRFNSLGALEHALPQMATNSSLRELDISTDEWADLEGFLDHIVLSKLSDLAVTLPDGHPFPIPTIEALIERSACPLQTVEITGVEIADEDLMAFLSSNDAVNTIRVY